MDKIKHIAYSIDKNQFILALVSMISILKNSSNEECIEFILLHDEINCKMLKSLKQLEKFKNCTYRLIKVDSSIFKNFPLSTWVKPPAWFRILLPDLCPETEKILYLDNDTLVCNSLEGLFSIDISNVILACVEDCIKTKEYRQKLQMKSEIYFNSGVLLINTKKWLKEDIYAKIEKFALANKDRIISSDQSCLNKIIEDNKLVISPKYDLMENDWRGYVVEYEGKTLEEYNKALNDPVIIHFTGAKPNTIKSGHKFKYLWWQYAKYTKEYNKLKCIYFLNWLWEKRLWLFSVKNKLYNNLKYKVLTIFGISFKFKYKC